MPESADRNPPLFVDAVDIPASLEADRGTSYAARLHRDRAVAASLPAGNSLQRVRFWGARVMRESDSASTHSVGQRLERGRHVIGLFMLILGALTGAGVASAAFHYDGTWPVNVVTVLAVLVLLQVALIVLTIVLMLPSVPGIRGLQDLMGGLNPGAVVATIYRRIARLDERAADLLVWPAARGPAVARFARWQMLVWSQIGAVAFNISALATAAALIAFTDLAFGWSTTLRVDSGDALRITNALAAPWAWFWPDAVPSASLIDSSRFFRLASASPPAISAETLTGWWPFLLAAIMAYGLAPRFMLLTIASIRLRAATAHLLLDDPQVKALLDRMGSSEVALGPEDVEAPTQSAEAVARGSPSGVPSRAVAIIWSNALPKDSVSAWSLRTLHKEVTQLVEAGGGRDLNEDVVAVRKAAEPRPHAVLLFVRAWEAPLLDLQDFIESLRAAVGPACSIVVVPIGPAGAPADEAQRTTWSRWVGRIADPALYMESGA
jgi:Protein of unknown function (DUF2868)